MPNTPTEDPYLYNEATLREVLHYVRRIVHKQTKMESLMSELTDQVDIALATLAEEAGEMQAEFDAALALQIAATAVVQSALDASLANEAVNTAELSKALAGLNAANATFTAMPSDIKPIVPIEA